MADVDANRLLFLKDGGEMGQLIRSKDWSTSTLGVPGAWPQSLRTSVSILLHSSFPMFVWWGPELITFYNNAYCMIAGEKHPAALGEPGPKVWAEIWDVIGPLADRVMRDGSSTWAEDQLLLVNRRGYVEEAYFTFSYSPVFDESGAVGGVFCACTETTEKVLAARRVQESERNLRNIILQAPVAMCILRGANFEVEIANSRMFELWGRSAAELLHRPIFDGLPEARQQGFRELLEQVYFTGETYLAREHPVRLPRHGKIETLYVNFVYEPFREGDGTISGVMAVAIDVTGLVLGRMKSEQSEQELQQKVRERTADLEHQKALVGSILDVALNAVMALDAVRDETGEVVDFRVILINKELKAIAGLDESVLGKSYLSCFPNSKENGVFQMYREVQQTGRPSRQEFYSTNMGANAWFDISAAPWGEGGIVSTFANISPLREAALRIEQQKNLLDSILKHTPAGITVYRAIRNTEGRVNDFHCILANDAAEAFTGINTADRYGRTVMELVPELKEGPLFERAVMALEEGTPFRSQYYNEYIGKWLELSLVKMYGELLINVFTDITPLKEAQLQLERNLEDLRRTNADLEHFAYAASHDMKEPIRKVNFFADRLKSSFGAAMNEEQRRYLERMEMAIRRMNTLNEDLLTYTEMNQVPQVSELVDLNAVMEQVLNDFDLEIEEKGAKVTVEKLYPVRGHSRQLLQAFHNLVGNALKYSKAGVAPQIAVGCRKVPGKDTGLLLSAEELQQEYYMITVSDNGIGFQQKDAARIFNVFQRLHDTQYRGTGLGLSIVRKVVENHDGYVTAKGEPGVGATFTVLLPVG